MAFIPKVIQRSKGDKVESEVFNNMNRDLYSDIGTLFEREIALYARTKILSTMVESLTASEEQRLRNNDTSYAIHIKTDFIYPDIGAKATVSLFYNEITSSVSDERSEIINTANGKIKPEIEIVRSSDNLIFSEIPESLTETRIEDAVEISEFPYLIRIRGIDESTSIRININSPYNIMDFNTIEFIPFPMIDGTELRGISFLTTEEGTKRISDPNEKSITFDVESDNLARPMRFITKPNKATNVNIDTVSNLYIPSSDAILLGITQFKVSRIIYEPISYIGFIINSDPDKTLLSIVPIFNDNNSYTSDISFTVYRTRNDFNQKNNNIESSFDGEGNGTPIKLDVKMYVLVTIITDSNTSAQIIGFDYTTD